MRLKGNQKLTVDDTIMCLALVSLEPVKVNAMTPAAQHIGLKLREQGQTFAGVFRQWDVDKDGFLSAAELSKGLGAVAPGVITKDEVQDFVKYVDEMGNEDMCGATECAASRAFVLMPLIHKEASVVESLNRAVAPWGGT